MVQAILCPYLEDVPRKDLYAILHIRDFVGQDVLGIVPYRLHRQLESLHHLNCRGNTLMQG